MQLDVAAVLRLGRSAGLVDADAVVLVQLANLIGAQTVIVNMHFVQQTIEIRTRRRPLADVQRPAPHVIGRGRVRGHLYAVAIDSSG